MGRLLGHFVDRVSYIFTFAGAALLLLMVALITVEVVLRYVFNTSTLFVDEVAPYLLVAIIYFGLSYALQTDRHIKVDAVTTQLKPKIRRHLRQVVALLNLPLGVIMLWRVWLFVLGNYETQTATPGILHTPQYIPQLAVLIGLAIFVLQATVQIPREFSRAGTRVEKVADKAEEE